MQRARRPATPTTLEAPNSQKLTQITRQAPPLARGNGIVTFVYGNAGRVKRKQAQWGDTVTYTFDLAGRMTTQDYRTAANSRSGSIADSHNEIYPWEISPTAS